MFWNKKKNQEEDKKPEPQAESPKTSEQAKPLTTVFGVEDTFNVLDSDDLIVAGRLKGTFKIGDAVYVSNLGDENNGGVFLTKIKKIEVNRKQVEEATDSVAGLLLENGKKAGTIKTGSVVHGRESTANDVHQAYVGSLGVHYIGMKNLDLTDDDLKRLTATDLAEIFLAFQVSKSKSKEETKPEEKDKLGKVVNAMVGKILSSKEIYVVYSSRTGEPYLFSRTFKNQDGAWSITPPDVMVITNAVYPVMKDSFSSNGYEIRKIENGEDGKGIYNELGRAFHINGACGMMVNGLSFSIDSNSIIQKPDYSDLPDISVPVTNPDLVRWLLLMGQFINVETEEAKLVYQLYYGIMRKELLKAQFLIPMSGDLPKGSGNITIEKGTQIILPVEEGKDGRQTIRAFTDWYRLRKGFDDKWGGMVQPMSGMIESFDFSINVTDHPGEGVYISKETYDSAVEAK